MTVPHYRIVWLADVQRWGVFSAADGSWQAEFEYLWQAEAWVVQQP